MDDEKDLKCGKDAAGFLSTTFPVMVNDVENCPRFSAAEPPPPVLPLDKKLSKQRGDLWRPAPYQ
ncbi:MAG TPA: hypothetical protein ENN44_06995 [Methanoculleus sp.]|nr:hypothetical protein [Methanoculleus sp.]